MSDCKFSNESCYEIYKSSVQLVMKYLQAEHLSCTGELLYFNPGDIVWILVLTFTWFLLRDRLVDFVFESKFLKLFPDSNYAKYKEQQFKAVGHLYMATFSGYLLAFDPYRTGCNPVWQPGTMWKELFDHSRNTWPMYILYTSAIAFFLCGLFANICMDSAKKDTHVLIIHHIFATFLLVYSYHMSIFTIGLWTLFLHALPDVFLEFAKLAGTLGFNKTKVVSAILFVLTWFGCRLFLFPVIILFEAAKVENENCMAHAVYFLILGCGLMVFNFFWTVLIINFVRRSIVHKAVFDPREFKKAE